jgi:hypothetical protein
LLKKKTLKHGRLNITKVWEHLMIKKLKNILRIFEVILYNLDMMVKMMMNQLIYVLIRKKQMKENNG